MPAGLARTLNRHTAFACVVLTLCTRSCDNRPAAAALSHLPFSSTSCALPCRPQICRANTPGWLRCAWCPAPVGYTHLTLFSGACKHQRENGSRAGRVPERSRHGVHYDQPTCRLARTQQQRQQLALLGAKPMSGREHCKIEAGLQIQRIGRRTAGGCGAFRRPCRRFCCASHSRKLQAIHSLCDGDSLLEELPCCFECHARRASAVFVVSFSPRSRSHALRFEGCMSATELRHMHVDDLRAALFVTAPLSHSVTAITRAAPCRGSEPDVSCMCLRSTCASGSAARCTTAQSSLVRCTRPPQRLHACAECSCVGGAERPQIGWFWNYVEQCAQAEKAEACGMFVCCIRN